MGPKKKQNPRNAFYFYMLDFREDEERRGRTFHGGLKDVADAASYSWKEMSPSDKQRYEAMAKAWKAEQRGDSSVKYTSTGISFAEVDSKIREEEEERLFMVQTVEREIQNLSNIKALQNKLFYLIHVNWYCMTSSQTYMPAEIAISEFSLKTGVNRIYHTFVNPGQPPMGYRRTAQEHIDATHQIPLNFEKGDSYFSKILREIQNFIKPGASIDDDFPALYTMPDSINYNTNISAVKSTLNMLCENESIAGGGYKQPKFNVFLLEKLFFELRNAAAKYAADEESQIFPSIGIPSMELEKEVFSANVNLACQFHQSIDRGIYCSVSKVKGWAYLICDFCCQNVAIDLIPGRHCPELVDKQYLRKTEEDNSPDYRKKLPGSKKKAESESEGWSSIRAEQEVNAWGVATPLEPETAVWGIPPANTSRSISMSAVLSSASVPPEFSEQNFPSMGRGRVGLRRGSSVKQISSGMRDMRLNK